MKSSKFFKAQHKFDDFELVKFLDGGEDGEVWQARKLSLGRGKLCAIKFLNIIEDEDKLRRFECEIDALSQLNHPHIVSIFERGKAFISREKDYVPYYVMEYIPGKDFDTAISKFPPDEQPFAICVFSEQILSALAAIQKEGLSHGDIKSANILVLPDNMIAKLSDFGFSLFIDEIRHRIKWRPSSHEPPPHLDPQQADLYQLGETLSDCIKCLPSPLPEKAKIDLDSLMDMLRVNASPAQDTTLHAISQLGLIKRAFPKGVIPELHSVPDSISHIYVHFHGDVPLSSRATAIIDSPPLQHLRNIKAFPSESLVFPSLSGSLFEVIIGQYAALRKALIHILRDVSISEVITNNHLEALFFVSLTWKAGQLPFAYQLQKAIANRIDVYDRSFSIIQKEPIRSILGGQWNLDEELIRALLFGSFDDWGDSPLSHLQWLLNHPLGPLQLEVMRKKSWGCGYSIPDTNKLYANITLAPTPGFHYANSLVIKDLAVNTVEEILQARSLLIKCIRRNHTIIAANLMLEKALAQIAQSDFDFNCLDNASDLEFLNICYEATKRIGIETASYLIEEFRERNIFRPISVLELPPEIRIRSDYSRELRCELSRELEKRISRVMEIDEKEIVVDLPDFSFEYGKIMILSDGNVVLAEKVSPVVAAAIHEIESFNRKIGVYVSRRLKDRLGEGQQSCVMRLLEQFLRYEIVEKNHRLI